MYGLTGDSMAQRVTLAVLLGSWLALAIWMVTGNGLTLTGSWMGRDWRVVNPVRAETLAAAFCVYYVRLLFTIFVFLRRGMSWTEVSSIASWVLFIFLYLGLAGSLNPASMASSGTCGAVLFAVGSWMNTWSECQRHLWKRRPEHRGKLYTEGLFRIARHPNYLGDLLAFSGLCVFAGRWFAWIVPALMLALFALVNIPVLDAHLREHYGEAFDAYAKRTARLIPFLY